MANSRFQYVKKFELSDTLLPDTYLIARLDGHRFTNFTAQHGFTKPNDERGLLLMAEVSASVLVCYLHAWLSDCLFFVDGWVGVCLFVLSVCLRVCLPI